MHGVVNDGDHLVIDRATPPAAGKVVLATHPATGERVVRFFEPLQPNDPRAPGFILRAENVSYADILSTNAMHGSIVGVAVRRTVDI